MILEHLLSLHEQLSLYHYFPREAIINLEMAAATLGRHEDHRRRLHLVDIVAVMSGAAHHVAGRIAGIFSCFDNTCQPVWYRTVPIGVANGLRNSLH